MDRRAHYNSVSSGLNVHRVKAEKPWSRLEYTVSSHYSIKWFQDSCYLILQDVKWRECVYTTLYTEQDLMAEIQYTPSISYKGSVEKVPALNCYSSHCSMARLWRVCSRTIKSRWSYHVTPPSFTTGAFWDSFINTSWRRQYVPIILSSTRTALVLVLKGSWLLNTTVTINWTIFYVFIMLTCNCL